AEAALHAGVLGEPQQRLLRIVAERAGRTGRDAGKAERAARNIDLDGAERRARRQRDHVDGRGRGALQLAQREPQELSAGAKRLETCGPWRAFSLRDGAQSVAERVGIVGLDGREAICPEPEAGEDRFRERESSPQTCHIVAWLSPHQESYRR